MCGIAGAIGAVDQQITDGVRAMQAAIVHRGPDGEGLWEGPGVVLAHRRLAILDLSPAGAQPMRDAQRGNVVCFNGEVYNFQALGEQLEAEGEPITSSSDTEVLLKRLGTRPLDDALAGLDGMFAFAFWDAGAGRLHLVRDRMGVKPLYYTTVSRPGGRVLLFASEVRALLASGFVERRLDGEGLRTFLFNGFVVDPHTIIRGVASLPPGHRLTLTPELDEAPSPVSWWSLPPSVPVPGGAHELKATLASAVQERLVSDVPLGVFLSGGVDSSAVADLASRSTEHLKTFCVAFPEVGGLDESGFAQEVADRLGTEHTTLPLEEAGFKAGLEQALGSLDQPTFDAVNTWFVSRAVKEAGLTVALAGTGGDEVFGGYTSFADLPRAERLARSLVAAPLPLLDRLASVATRLKTGTPGEVGPQTRFGKLADVLATRGDRVALYQVSYSLFTRSFLRELSGREDERWGLSESILRRLQRAVADEHTLHAVTQMELSLFLGNRLLRDTDTASMDVALEVRVPLVDHRVIEAAARVDPERRCLPAQQKRLLKELALTDEVRGALDREKAGFEMPFARWCREGLKDAMSATFADDDALRSVGLLPEAVQRLWRSFLDDAPGIYWSRVWSLYILVHWCRAHRVTR